MFNFFHKPKAPNKLPFTTDIHCHLLPGVDDGAPDTATSLDLLRRMSAWGITSVWASPHVTKDVYENTPARLDAVNAALRAEVEGQGVGVSVNHHAEYRLDDYSLACFGRNDIMAMPGGYVMIENPFVAEAWFIENTVFDLQVKGYTPVLAHPERYSYYITDRSRYARLHSLGAKFQINLLSLANAYGHRQLETAEWLMANGMADFVGTDVHNAAHAGIIDRYLPSKNAARHFSRLSGTILNDRIDAV